MNKTNFLHSPPKKFCLSCNNSQRKIIAYQILQPAMFRVVLEWLMRGGHSSYCHSTLFFVFKCADINIFPTHCHIFPVICRNYFEVKMVKTGHMVNNLLTQLFGSGLYFACMNIRCNVNWHWLNRCWWKGSYIYQNEKGQLID